jgi:hypothetical protein
LGTFLGIGALVGAVCGYVLGNELIDLPAMQARKKEVLTEEEATHQDRPLTATNNHLRAASLPTSSQKGYKSGLRMYDSKTCRTLSAEEKNQESDVVCTTNKIC